MSIVAVVAAPGSSGSTTLTMMLGARPGSPAAASLVAECDPTGGDIAAWTQVSASPGWASAVAASDRTWRGVEAHVQHLPGGQRALLAPSRSAEARTAIHAARSFVDVLATDPTAVFADCGRFDVAQQISPWITGADLTLLVVRQVKDSAPATVAVVDRGAEALEGLRGLSPRVAVVLVGGAPYPPREIETALGVPLLAALPEDPAGAGAVAGAWSLLRGTGRSPLARAVGELADRVGDIVTGSRAAGAALAAAPPPVRDVSPPVRWLST